MRNEWLTADELYVLRAFMEAGVIFMIVGGRAVQFHGHDRFTKDLDLLIEATPENGRRLRGALKTVGTTLSDPDAIERISEEWRVKISLERYPVECLTAIYGVRFADAWEDAVETAVDGMHLRVLSKPDLIASKQHKPRDRDTEDVNALLNSAAGAHEA